jgi:DNA-binding XRE family transcriptional regulator
VVQLDSWDLKKWRKRLGYNQFEAAERLGVHRGAIQNWEREVRPVPLTVELACEELEREHQSLNQKSVLLVCTDGPIVQPSTLHV